MEGMHMKFSKLAALVAVTGLTLAACSGGSEQTAGEAPSSDIRICVYTHGDGGTFWSVAEKGARQAGADLGITVDYQGSSNDASAQARLIQAGVTSGCDAIAASAPDPGAIKDAMLAAQAAGIPTVTLNSGSAVFRDLGAFTHVGQDEIVAGREAGLKFKAAGVSKILCPIQEANNSGLTDRCKGARETAGVEVIDFNIDGGLADLAGASQKIQAALEADSTIDAVFALNADIAAGAVLPAAEAVGRDILIGTVDLSSDALKAISEGKMAFAIDQQQYAQGYMAVAMLYLNLTNAHELGGGLPVYTGPGFVTADNVAKIQELVASGTR
jgi:simple sugar transport system substrate-binding protein